MSVGSGVENGLKSSHGGDMVIVSLILQERGTFSRSVDARVAHQGLRCSEAPGALQSEGQIRKNVHCNHCMSL